MNDTTRLRLLRRFLQVYGGLSLLLFTFLLGSFTLEAPYLQPGGALAWTIWDSVSDHVGPMLFVIYIVWSVFLMRAAADPAAHGSFLDFTAWANLAHGVVMIPQALGMHRYHTKFLTDIPWILVLPAVLFWLRRAAPGATSLRSAA